MHSLREQFDILYVLGFRASAAYLLHRFTKTKVVFNTDGFDWQRSKWGRLGRRYLKVSESLGVKCATGGLIADSRTVARYFAQHYGREPTYLSYGVLLDADRAVGAAKSYGLNPGEYYLVVARLEPENHVLHIIDEFLSSGSRRTLAVVGGQNYSTPYAARIRARGSDRVRLLGSIYDQSHLDALYHSCFAYVHGHAVGGTNPSLLRAMGAGALVLANGVDYNREVLGMTGLYWSPDPRSLSELIRQLEVDPELNSQLGCAARDRVRRLYDWESIADQYASHFRELARSKGSREPTLRG
jgi:glycosyltransferase involved in cell wall biosynthesis